MQIGAVLESLDKVPSHKQGDVLKLIAIANQFLAQTDICAADKTVIRLACGRAYTRLLNHQALQDLGPATYDHNCREVSAYKNYLTLMHAAALFSN
jgi:hypothetical protein